ncbi:MAG TPA: YIP1 family protein [Acholeplasma sp.]|nr:YIP1 family protein [Acholeplasma sp.]
MKIKLAIQKFWYNFIRFPKYVLFHPFDGYDELKREKKGKVSVAVIFMLLFILLRIYKYLGEGFVINPRNPLALNTFDEFFSVALLIFLFTVGNWSITTLLEGKGTYREIFIVTGYSLFPVVIIGFPAVFISNYLTLDEIGLYSLAMSAAYFLTGVMLFMGILNIHEYGLLKTIFTFILTVVAMAFMAFLGLLFFDLIQQFLSFVKSVYQELRLRY